MKPNKLAHDVIVNVVFAVAKGVALLWAVSLLTGALAPAALGIFLFARRLAATASNLLQLGMSQTLLRYIPFHQDEPLSKRIYARIAIVRAAIMGGLVVMLLHLLNAPLSSFLFPEAAEAPRILFWTGIIISGSIFHYVSYACFLGERQVYIANILEFMAVAGILLLALIANDLNPGLMIALQWLGIGTLFMGVSASLAYLLVPGKTNAAVAGAVPGKNTAPIAAARKEFREYGLPRGGIAFLDMMTLTIGPWLIREDPVATGYLLLALTAMRVLISAIMPVTQILSVVTARLAGLDDQEKIRKGTRLLFGGLLYVTALGLAFLAPFGDRLIDLWLPDEVAAQGVWNIFRVIGFGILPMAIFYGMRGVIETRWREPRNLWSLGLGIATHLTLYVALVGSTGQLAAVNVAILGMLLMMGTATLWWVRADISNKGYYDLGLLLVVLGWVLFVGFISRHVFADPGLFVAMAADSITLALICWQTRRPLFLGDALKMLLRPGSNARML